MDEPTSALDPISTSKIEELAMTLKEDYTIIMVTHNPALESHFDQVIRLRDGLTEDTVGEVTQ